MPTELLLLAAILTILCLFGARFLSKKSWCEASVSALLSLSFCLSAELILAVLRPAHSERLLSLCLCVMIPLLLWPAMIAIFPRDYVLTKEQRKTVVSRQIFFFPGLILLLTWQILLLCSLIPQSLLLMIFTLLFQLVVIIALKQQAISFQTRIERIIDKQYQADLLNFMQVIRSQRHDFNFHIQTIYGMIKSGQFDECLAYVSSMMKSVQSTNDLLPLYHPATSALLNTFREMALQKGLQMEIEIHDNLQFIATSVYETNTILGNLLQNAIDELELHPENESRLIRLLIIKRGRYNMIKVSNQCHLSPEEMSRVFTPGFTTKNSHEGLGLANALRITEQHDGTLYPEFEGSTVHFIARIPMQ